LPYVLLLHRDTALTVGAGDAHLGFLGRDGGNRCRLGRRESGERTDAESTRDFLLGIAGQTLRLKLRELGLPTASEVNARAGRSDPRSSTPGAAFETKKRSIRLPSDIRFLGNSLLA